MAVEDVKQWVSLGAEELVRAALAEAYRDRDLDVTEFRAEYAGIKTPAECLYDGIPETLGILRSAGLMLAVCSNKPQQLCAKVLEDTGISEYFSVVVGGDAVVHPKPHPAHLRNAMDAMGVTCEESIYIGDSSIDFLASQAAGVPFVLARYGYADPPMRQMARTPMESLESPKDLPALLARRMGVSTL